MTGLFARESVHEREVDKKAGGLVAVSWVLIKVVDHDIDYLTTIYLFRCANVQCRSRIVCLIERLRVAASSQVRDSGPHKDPFYGARNESRANCGSNAIRTAPIMELVPGRKVLRGRRSCREDQYHGESLHQSMMPRVAFDVQAVPA